MIPTRIRIGAQFFEVIEDPNLCRRSAFGEFDASANRITVDSSCALSRQQQTLIHEAIEAANHEYHIGLEHDQVEQLECAVYQMALDNPGLFDVSASVTAKAKLEQMLRPGL
jgi:hypothetical protein